MENFLPKSSQSEIFKGMMRNPSNAKLMKEALASPIGSTSRQKAKKLFSIMNKLHASRDGMGGPGMMYDQQAYGQYPAPQNDPIQVNGDNSKGMVIFHKIPKPNINFTDNPGKIATLKPNIHRFDGSGGPGLFGTSDPYSSFSSQPNMSVDNSNTHQPNMSIAPAPVTPPAAPPANDFWAVTPLIPEDPNKKQGWEGVKQNLQTYGNWLNNNLGAPAWAALSNKGRPGFDQDGYPLPGYDSNGVLIKADSSSSAPNMSVDTSANQGSPYTYGNQQSTPTDPSLNQNQTPTGGNSGNTSNFNASSSGGTDAANNYSVSLGGADMNMNLSDAINKYGINAIVDQAILKNEGKPVVATNPGNIKFVGAPGQTDSGIKAADGGTFASYASYQAGRQAVVGILQNAASGKTSSYGPNPTLLSFANTYTGSTGLTGQSSAAQGAVDQTTGPGMFAFNQMLNPNDPITGGLSLTQRDQANQKVLWDKYNIGGLQDQMMKLEAEGATLPRDVADYITGRDQYIKQTDQNIANFVNQSMTGTAMSDPANVQKASAQLNYLYTLRGRQNQSYIGYLTDAVNQHQADLNNITNQYSTALNSYNAQIASDNTTTAAQYTQYAQALSDMYTAVDGAPAKLQQALLNQANILIAQGQAVSDPIKKAAQNGIITQGKQVETYWGWDGSKDVGTTPDLVKTINDLSSLQPDIQPINIIQTYANDIIKYSGLADVQPNSANTNGPNVVTSTTKKKILENAISNFAHLYIASAPQTGSTGGSTGGDSTMQLLANNYITQFSNSLAASVGGSLTKNAPNLMTAIQTLSPSGWFAGKTPPTESQFVSTFTKASGNPSDSVIASAVYQAFKEYTTGTPAQGGNPAIPAGTPAGAVNALLYNTSSTTTKAVPFTADQFAQNLGHIYATSLVQSALATQ